MVLKRAFISSTFSHSAITKSDHFNTTIEYASGLDYDLSKYPTSVCDVNSSEYDKKKCRRRNQIIQEGNTTIGDGPTYKGKGIIQLTWKGTYNAYKEYSGSDVVSNPMKVAEDLATAVSTAFLVLGKNLKERTSIER